MAENYRPLTDDDLAYLNIYLAPNERGRFSTVNFDMKYLRGESLVFSDTPEMRRTAVRQVLAAPTYSHAKPTPGDLFIATVWAERERLAPEVAPATSELAADLKALGATWRTIPPWLRMALHKDAGAASSAMPGPVEPGPGLPANAMATLCMVTLYSGYPSPLREVSDELCETYDYVCRLGAEVEKDIWSNELLGKRKRDDEKKRQGVKFLKYDDLVRLGYVTDDVAPKRPMWELSRLPQLPAVRRKAGLASKVAPRAAPFSTFTPTVLQALRSAEYNAEPEYRRLPATEGPLRPDHPCFTVVLWLAELKEDVITRRLLESNWPVLGLFMRPGEFYDYARRFLWDTAGSLPKVNVRWLLAIVCLRFPLGEPVEDWPLAQFESILSTILRSPRAIVLPCELRQLGQIHGEIRKRLPHWSILHAVRLHPDNRRSSASCSRDLRAHARIDWALRTLAHVCPSVNSEIEEVWLQMFGSAAAKLPPNIVQILMRTSS